MEWEERQERGGLEEFCEDAVVGKEWATSGLKCE